MSARIIQFGDDRAAILIDRDAMKALSSSLRVALDVLLWNGYAAPRLDEFLWLLERVGEGRPDLPPILLKPIDECRLEQITVMTEEFLHAR